MTYRSLQEASTTYMDNLVFIDQFSGLFRSIKNVLYRTVYTYV